MGAMQLLHNSAGCCDVRLRRACNAMQRRRLACQPAPPPVLWRATATRRCRPRSSQPSIARATSEVSKAARIALTAPVRGEGDVDPLDQRVFPALSVHHERQAHPPGRGPPQRAHPAVRGWHVALEAAWLPLPGGLPGLKAACERRMATVTMACRQQEEAAAAKRAALAVSPPLS